MWINVKVQITWTKRKHGETFGVLFLAESVSFIRRWFLAQWSKSAKSRWKTERCQTHKGKAQRTPIHTITLLWKECQNMGFYCIRLWQMKTEWSSEGSLPRGERERQSPYSGCFGFFCIPRYEPHERKIFDHVYLELIKKRGDKKCMFVSM